MHVDENLMCSFKILKAVTTLTDKDKHPAEKK